MLRVFGKATVFKSCLLGLLVACITLPIVANATSSYRDLVYQVYVSNKPTNQFNSDIYLTPLPKQVVMHLQPDVPDVPIQLYPLEPITSAALAVNMFGVNGSVAMSSTTSMDPATLAANFTRKTQIVHGDWNSDGRQDILILGNVFQSIANDGYPFNYLLLHVINNGTATLPTLNYTFIPTLSPFGMLMGLWNSGDMVPAAIDLKGNHKLQSLAFTSKLLNATGNPDTINVIPDNDGKFTRTGTTIQLTGDYSPPTALPDVNSADPSQILPRVVGATGGSHSVALDGSANYQIPIAVPPAAGGIQPTLSLNYSNSAGNSNMGFGWSLSGTSHIGRCGKSFKQDGSFTGVQLTSADQLCLDGQRLILKSGTHGLLNAEYRLENEIFARVVVQGSGSDGMPTSLTVQTPEGSVATYGGTGESRSVASGVNAGKILEWHLSQTKDRFGNYRDYHYLQNTSNGSIAIREIDYGGNLTASTSHTNKVVFDYTANPVGYLGFLQGTPLSSPQLLKQVSVFAGSTELRFYALRYKPAPQHGVAYLMDSVAECSGNGSCLSPTSFTWVTNVGTQAFSAAQTAMSGTTDTTGALEQFVDMNGDGLPDRVWMPTNSFAIWVALAKTDGSGFNAATQWGTAYNPTNTPLFLMGDANGDGLPDLVEIWQNGVTDGVKVLLNTGSALQTPVTWLTSPGVFLYNNATVLANMVTLADLNGDGLVDIVDNNCSISGTTSCAFKVSLSNGSAFQTFSTWTTTNTLNNYSQNLSRHTLQDVTGDGLPDRVWMPDTSAVDIYVSVNTGNSFGTPTLWLNHTATSFALTASDAAWEGYSDFNGDGLADRYWIASLDASGANRQLYVALSDGTKFLAPSLWFYHNVINIRPPAGMGLTFADVNDDGLVDMLWTPSYAFGTSAGAATGDVEVALQTSGSFGYPTAWLTGITASTTGRQSFLDLNGDGMVDFLWYPGASTTTINAALSQAKPTAEMTTVTNGFGHQTIFSYDTLMSSAVYDKGDTGVTYPNSNGKVYIKAPKRVVSHVDVSNGIGGLARSTYKYKGLVTDTKTRQSLGYAEISVLNEVTGLKDITTYSQDLANNLQGLITETKTVDTATNYVLSDTVNSWQVDVLHDSVNASQSRYVRKLLTTNVTKRDLLNNLLYTEANNYNSYDSYGHILTQSTTENNAAGNLLKTTNVTNTYINDTTNWLLGLADTVTVANDVTANAYSDSFDPVATSRTSSWEYDNSAQRKLVAEKIWNDSVKTTALLTTTYSNYDNFGHALTTTVSGPDFATRSSSAAYDSSGRFVLTATNALSQTVTNTYYDATTVSSGAYPGMLKTGTDLNGVVTFNKYDGYGRPQSTTAAYGSSSPVTSSSQFVTCASVASDCATLHAAYAITSQSDGSGTSTVFYDQLGRDVRRTAPIMDGTLVSADKQYDAYGNNVKVSEPYLPGGTLLWTQSVYDKLGRVTSTTGTDGRVDTASYVGLVTTTTVDTAGANQSRSETRNALGQLVTITDAAGKTLQQRFDSSGSLVKTIDASNNLITLGYDLMGRKTSMADPDKGNWSYTYNTLGQLITQKNARNEVTCMAYDIVGRMTKRVDNFAGTLSDGTPGQTGKDSTNQCANAGASAKTSTWVYDTAAHGIGKLATVTLENGTNYSESHSYDALGRPASTTQTIKGAVYATDMQYDSLNRPSIVTYPGPSGDRFAVKNIYNTLGFNTQILNASTNTLYWQMDAMDVRGNVTQQHYGNGVASTNYFEGTTGKPVGITANSGLTSIQNITLNFNKVGNLMSRSDAAMGVSETFSYDNLNRLTSSSSNFGNNDLRVINVTYDTAGLGNIKTKTGVGTYYYGAECSALTNQANGFVATPHGPHAVCGVVGTTANGEKNTPYSYDANGNMTAGDNRTISWNVHDLPTSIVQGANTTTIEYGPENQRYHRTDTTSAGTVDTIQAAGGLYEKITQINSDTDERHYIGGFAVVTIHNRAIPATRTQNTRYLHKDHLGSPTAITNESGGVVELQSYDAWGARRAPNMQTMLALAQKTLWNDLSVAQKNDTAFTATQLKSSVTNNGYTGHEMLDPVGLIHMNGRVYDPQLGRFLSADSVVDDAGDMQAFNRYSYVHNNPLVYTDPTGNFSLGSLWKHLKHAVWSSVKPYVRYQQHLDDTVVRAVGRVFAKVPILQAVVDTVLICFGQVWAVPLFNAAVSASVTYESTGNIGAALKGGAIAYAASVVTLEAGGLNAFGSMTTTQITNAATIGNFAASMAVGGAISKAQGGKFFDSKAFMESMAASWTTSYAVGVWNGQQSDQVALKEEVAQLAKNSENGQGDYSLSLVVERPNEGSNTGHLFDGGQSPFREPEAWGFYSDNAKSPDALFDFGSSHLHGSVHSDTSLFLAALNGDKDFAMITWKVNASTYNQVMGSIHTYNQLNDYGLACNSCMHGALSALHAAGLIKSPTPEMSIRPQILYDTINNARK